MKNTRSILYVAGLVGMFALGLVFTDVRSVRAGSPSFQVEGSCSRGDLLVFESSDRARCISLREVRMDSCDSGAFLTSRNGRLTCVGPSSTPWGAEGLLPRCSRDEIVVSEGFGRWKCAATK